MAQTFQDKKFYKLELTSYYLKSILLLRSFDLKVSLILFYCFTVNNTVMTFEIKKPSLKCFNISA